ncbi:uncharacterized protein N7459_005778 [Penicillium hispanicum]|uniref:uncharacterized protein n=1 Tax=Penicillium hispanicum TaxID=1080232 RepID=UPI0025400000|nr:uncharacterized protein N7459_005778 [Penicillium hispanicum]KAJ5579793.1 hypothetical protein N7459_005778 [Penicillium hispanicum]
MSALRNSRTASVQVRGFATTSSRRIGPESPQFIDIPRPIQPSNPVKPNVKGTLPVPREIFPARRADKPRKAYLDAVTPEPATERTVNPKSGDAEKQAFKLKMAVLRRQNLRAGLRDLYKRKRAAEDTMFNRSIQNQAQRERILQQPEPEDERLTRPSVVQAMKAQKHSVLADPNREERLTLSKARMEARQTQKDAQRQDDLQSLYMNARTFITTEEQLAAEIDRVFPDGENEAWRNDHQPGENIWNLGIPPTVQSVVNVGRKSETARWDVIQDRVKKLGEQITGGKL